MKQQKRESASGSLQSPKKTARSDIDDRGAVSKPELESKRGHKKRQHGAMRFDELDLSPKNAALSDCSQAALAREAFADQPIMDIGPDVLPNTLTNERGLHIGADILVEQAATPESFSKAAAAIECMDESIHKDHLVDKFYTRGCVQVLEYINRRNAEAATSISDVLYQLPDIARVTDHMSHVIEKCRDVLIKAIDHRSFQDAEYILKVMCSLPPSMCFFEVAGHSRNCLIEDINGRKLDDAEELLRMAQWLPSSAHIPRNFFSIVVKTCRTCAIEDMNDGKLGDAERIVDLVLRLPYHTRVPDDHFSELLETCRGCLIKYIEDGNFEEAKEILEILFDLGRSMRIPDDYFSKVTKTCRDRLVKHVKVNDHEKMQEDFEFLDHLSVQVDIHIKVRNRLDSRSVDE